MCYIQALQWIINGDASFMQSYTHCGRQRTHILDKTNAVSCRPIIRIPRFCGRITQPVKRISNLTLAIRCWRACKAHTCLRAFGYCLLAVLCLAVNKDFRKLSTVRVAQRTYTQARKLLSMSPIVSACPPFENSSGKDWTFRPSIPQGKKLLLFEHAIAHKSTIPQCDVCTTELKDPRFRALPLRQLSEGPSIRLEQ